MDIFHLDESYLYVTVTKSCEQVELSFLYMLARLFQDFYPCINCAILTTAIFMFLLVLIVYLQIICKTNNAFLQVV